MAQVVDVYKQAAFDWPLGPLGRIRQKYGKPKVPKSKSEDQLAEVGHEHKTAADDCYDECDDGTFGKVDFL